MTSVAVLLNGCIRESFDIYGKVIENINTYLKDFETIDIYFHTWSPFDTTNIDRLEFSFNQTDLVEYLSKQKNIHKIIVEKQTTKEDLDKLDFPFNQFLVKVGYIYPTRTSIFACFSAFKTLANAVVASAKNYDYVLRTRNDLLIEIPNFSNIIASANLNKLCIPKVAFCDLNDPRFINDHWIFGKTINTLKAIDYKDMDFFKQTVQSSWNQEEITKKIYKTAECEFYFFDVSSYFLYAGKRKLK